MTHFFRRVSPLACLIIGLMMSPPAATAKPERSLPLALWLKGGLTFTPADNGKVQIKADMAGVARHFGMSKAEAVWLAPQTVIADLESGAIQQANIGAGTLNAITANGSSVTGSFTGRLVRLRSGLIGFESSFIVNGGTGHLAGTSGDGIMIGTADPESLEFRLKVIGSLVRK